MGEWKRRIAARGMSIGVLATAALPVGQCSGTAGEIFRSVSADEIGSGIKTILDAVVDGVVIVVDANRDNNDSNASDGTSNDT